MSSNEDSFPARDQHSDSELEITAELPADATSASLARRAIRQALAAWRIEDLDRDGELLASELVTNAAIHAPGRPISFAVRLDYRQGQQRGVTCEVTDSSPALPQTRHPSPDHEHGRGMAIVNALAAACGSEVRPHGKTTWFTLALHDRINRIARQPEPDREAGG